jgi:hypothetical protein
MSSSKTDSPNGKRILWMWVAIMPLFAVVVMSQSCQRYSTGPNWTWRAPEPRIYPVLDEDPYAVPYERPPTPTFVQDPDYGESEAPVPTAETHYRVYVVRTVLKACSPQDPHDSAYYRRHGFKGEAYNLCTDYQVIPKGSRIQLPEGTWYMEESYPQRWWSVDAPIGKWGRQKGTGRGDVWADVKYRTYHSSRKFGTKVVDARVILPEGYEPGRVFLTNVVEVIWLPRE